MLIGSATALWRPGNGLANCRIAETDRTATIVLRPTSQIDGLECAYEGGEIERGTNGIVESVESRQLARQPSHHGPWIGERRFRLPGRHRQGHGKWEVGSEDREPPALLFHVVDRPVDPGEPHRQVVAEPIHGVVGARRRDPFDGELSPLRVLIREQATHEVSVGGHLVFMHSP